MRLRKRLAAPALAALVVLQASPAVVASEQSYAPFVIRPYLTQLSTDHAVISWRQLESGPASFEFQVEGSAQVAAAPSGQGPQHTVRLQGLLPGTRYLYQVNGAFRGAFETIRPGEGARFVALGHTHGTEQFTHYPDRLLVARAQELEPDFLVHMGDATYIAKPHDFQKYFFAYFGDMISRVPVFLSPGNHDAGWPFVYGPNLSVFRELFAYPYAPGVEVGEKQAHYKVTWGEVQFYFLSYSTGIGPNAPQRKWLARELAASQAAFDIVVYGGAQTGHYDREELLASLGRAKVDLVLNGDGLQPKRASPLEWVDDLPIIFAGTYGPRPHLLVYFEQEDLHLTARYIDATGAQRGADWFYSKRRFTPQIDLVEAPTEPLSRDRGIVLTHRFATPVAADEIRGLQMTLSNELDKTVRFIAYVDPANLGPGPHGERGFRTQYQSFSGKDSVVTMLLPQQNPFTGNPYEIQQIRIHLFGVERLSDLKPTAIYLF